MKLKLSWLLIQLDQHLNGNEPFWLTLVCNHPLRAGQTVPYAYQTLPNRFKYANVGSVISQSTADQGSRTGIKGSGILSSININGGGAEPTIGKQKSAICVPEPGSSSPLL
ncbi:hypothetical protein L6452_18197 [Arctium lappa]|uniref:Uncharacterized protein n=1 Tax=Arctium lappa TaxID=4217 RepID=A0ACB9C5J9_ARCLA|nr:hypothetical protein L6452_18197 [Arctium lappa]